MRKNLYYHSKNIFIDIGFFYKRGYPLRTDIWFEIRFRGTGIDINYHINHGTKESKWLIGNWKGSS
jgi:hypothetical protein|tara:strand:+ start:4090 stop:4287 length:198 start_codon:yes stop_codon:yes gene_type:complete